MAAFGKADIGLIKATAGAEAGQYVDENLMIGSAIGGALDAISKQQAALKEQNAALQKEIEGSFKPVTGNPDQQFLEYLGGVTPAYTSQFASLKGKGGFWSKQKQQLILENYNGEVGQIEDLTVGINLLR